jgi:hypothetical protein
MTRTELMEAIVHYAGDTVRARRMYRQSHSMEALKELHLCEDLLADLVDVLQLDRIGALCLDDELQYELPRPELVYVAPEVSA